MTRTVIHGGAVFDGIARGSRPATVVLEDGLIADVLDDGSVPAADVTIDASGGTVLPGLTNTHVHLSFMYMTGDVSKVLTRGDADLYAHAFRVSKVLLAQGITLARDMAGPRGIHLAVRDIINDGRLLGPTVIACGSPLVASGRHAWSVCMEADGPDEMVAAVRQQFKEGADFIKLMASDDPVVAPDGTHTLPGFSAEEVAAAYAEVRRHGALACCHVMGEEAIRTVLDNGADIIDHGHYLTDELARRMAADGVYLTPTISSYDVQTTHPRFDRGKVWADRHTPLIPPHKSAVRAAIDAGVKMLVGTDTVGCFGEEVALLREAGMDAHDSLLACTRWPAEAFRMDDRHGTIAPGLRADIAIVDGDPLADPYALEQVRQVIKGGEVYESAQLVADERRLSKNIWELALSPKPADAD